MEKCLIVKLVTYLQVPATFRLSREENNHSAAVSSLPLPSPSDTSSLHRALPLFLMCKNGEKEEKIHLNHRMPLLAFGPFQLSKLDHLSVGLFSSQNCLPQGFKNPLVRILWESYFPCAII